MVYVYLSSQETNIPPRHENRNNQTKTKNADVKMTPAVNTANKETIKG